MSISIVEVGPRDGLQNEKQYLSPQIKIELMQRLIQSGLTTVEAGAFVSPKAIPQMAGSDEVLKAMCLYNPGINYPVLVPNLKGFEAALVAGAKEIAVFTAASNSFTQANINSTIEESLIRFKPVFEEAKKKNIKVRGYVSCVVHCPYEGFITPEQVIPVCEALLKAGCYQISLGDTTGHAAPIHTRRLLKELLPVIPAEYLAGHFHDTYGQAIANIATALEAGIECFDSSVAGLGGCPYAPGASGNVATEDVVYLMQSYGHCQDINLKMLAETGRWISGQLQRSYSSKAGIAIMANQHTRL